MRELIITLHGIGYTFLFGYVAALAAQTAVCMRANRPSYRPHSHAGMLIADWFWWTGIVTFASAEIIERDWFAASMWVAVMIWKWRRGRKNRKRRRAMRAAGAKALARLAAMLGALRARTRPSPVRRPAPVPA